MSRGIKRMVLGLGAVLAVLAAFLVLVAAIGVYRPATMMPLAEKLLRPPGGTASLEGLEVGLRPPVLVLQGLDVRWADPDDRLRLERLRAVIVPGRVLGRDPWLRALEIHGLEVRRHLRGEGTGGPPDLSPLSWLFAVEDLTVREARFDVDVGGTEVTLDGLSLSLTPVGDTARALALEAGIGLRRAGATPTRGWIRGIGEITAEQTLALRLDLTVPSPAVSGLGGDLNANADLALSPKRMEVGALELELSGARLRWTSGEAWELGTGRASLAGGVGLDGSDPRVELSRLDVGDLLQGRGSVSGPTLARLSGRMDATLLDVGLLKAGLSPLLPADLRDLDAGGELLLRLEGSASRDGLSLALDARPEEIVLSWPSRGLEARLGGTLRVTAPLRGPTAETWAETALEGRLEAVADLARPPLAVRSVHLALPLSGSVSALRSRGASLSVGSGQVLWDGRTLPLGNLSAQGNMALDGAAVRIDAFRIESGALGRIEGEATLDAGVRTARLTGDSFPLGPLSDLLWAAADLPGQAWHAEGSAAVTARVDPAEGGERVAAELRLLGAGFSSPDGELLAQGLEGSLALESRTGPSP
ncbi:MAG: hypothetical protein ACNA8S_16540, partial [Deferrisomatales bacterium]